jgi:hypothetical protein
MTLLHLNILEPEERSRIVDLLVEGCSIRAVSRLAKVSRTTIADLQVDLGAACAAYHDEHVRRLKVQRLQADEIQSFIGSSRRDITPRQKSDGWGKVWTWVAIDADTKLIVSYFIGALDEAAAKEFVDDFGGRILTRPQLTTKTLDLYPQAVKDVFGSMVDYAQIRKAFGSPSSEGQSPRLIGISKHTIYGNPHPDHISTSYVERHRLNLRRLRIFT